MSEKYRIALHAFEDKRDAEYDEILDSSALSFKLGSRELFNIICPSPQGYKRVTIVAKVEKYP